MNTSDKEFQDWLNNAAERTGSKINDSAAYAGIITKNFMKDPLCALQLGYAILLDKPIFLIVGHDQTVPPALVKIAKRIERVDLNKPADMDRAAQSLREFAKEIKNNEKSSG